MPDGTLTDWATTATELHFELPKEASLPATVDGEPLERRKVARPLPPEERVHDALFWNGSGKLHGRVAIISGGSEEIRHAMALLFAREGADVAIIYGDGEEEGAKSLVKQLELTGKRALAIGGDITDTAFCNQAAEVVAAEFGKIDLLLTSLR